MRMEWCGAVLALALLVTQASAQFGGEPEAAPVKSDLPYIRCAVCEAVAKNAYRQVKAARDALKPGKKVSPSPVSRQVPGFTILRDEVSFSITKKIKATLDTMRLVYSPVPSATWQPGKQCN